MDRQSIGRRGEALAAQWVRSRGWRVIDSNWRCPAGEIDLVALDGEHLVVIEVKTRTGTGFGHPAEAVTASKLGRLRRLAAHWVAAHDLRPASIRVDVIAVLLLGHRARIELLAGER
ncbi:YraN family protein [Cellulomonas taurus]|uniref:YraN family protein n=1 Tax=Cellulomonas taurus TaxID=2729175 RepID=UPI00145E2434|nr:YraN family protein [Cellulomonas taurus]